jgi:hypothetical protein
MRAVLLRALGDRLAIIVATLGCCACGRVGFRAAAAADGGVSDVAPDGADSHLHTATGWVISPLADLGAAFTYVQDDFVEGMGTLHRDNAPRYVAALYLPFSAELAVIAGRSVIEVAADGMMTNHDYRPLTPDTTGPDAPARITFADFGGGDAALWLTATSNLDGDGLYRIDAGWSMKNISTANNTFGLVFDASGAFDGRGGPTLYSVAQGKPSRQQAGGSDSVNTSLPDGVDDLAALGNALYFTVETQTQVLFNRLGPGTSYLKAQLDSATSTSLVLAEGTTDGGLFAIQDSAKLVVVDPASGGLTQVAWSDDPAWAWVAVSAPRAGHRLAHHLIVLESNRTLDRDRLLVLAPQ